jgi:Flp pilus assembly protein TadG
VRRKRERGSAVVEFALLLPILLLVLLAVVQVGVLASDQLVITQAARAGARA